MNLPSLATTRIEIPRSTKTIKSRSLHSTRSVVANFPKPSIPAPSNPSREYQLLAPQEKHSAEQKVDSILKGANISSCPVESVPNVVIVFKELKRLATINVNYTLSKNIEDIIIRLNSLVIQKKYVALKNQEVKSIYIQLSKAENVLSSLISQWNSKIEEFNKTQSIYCKRLENNQLMRLEEYDGSQSNKLPPSFCKFSPTLLELRELEKRLVISKRYDEATRIHKEADLIQKKEEENQKKKFLEVNQINRKKLLESQQLEVDCFKERWVRQSEKFQKEMEKEISAQKKVVEHLKLKIKDTENEQF